MEKLYKAVNWNEPDNNYIMAFWKQNLKQYDFFSKKFTNYKKVVSDEILDDVGGLF